MTNDQIGRTLLARAYDYVMYCAGRGADAPTLTSYLTTLDAFLPAWKAWADPGPPAHSLSQPTLLAAIPMLSKLVSPLSWNYVPPGTGASVYVPAPAATFPEPPPAVTSCVTLALQHYMLNQAGQGSGYSAPAGQVTTRASVLSGLLAQCTAPKKRNR